MTMLVSEELRQRILDATRNPQFAGTRDIAALLDEEGICATEEFRRLAVERQKLEVVRRIIQSMRDEHGSRDFESTSYTDESGVRRVVYKQVEMFTPDDFKKSVSYHHKIAQHHAERAVQLAERANTKYGYEVIQLEMALDGHKTLSVW